MERASNLPNNDNLELCPKTGRATSESAMDVEDTSSDKLPSICVSTFQDSSLSSTTQLKEPAAKKLLIPESSELPALNSNIFPTIKKGVQLESKPVVGNSNTLLPKPLPINQLAIGSATGNPRNKIALRPGYSLMDWIRLTKTPGKDLSGRGGKRYLDVTPAELKKHSKRDDAWIAINNIVFNITAYMDYHPGGWKELIRGAGIDATDLFNEVHRWVNYESMLAACLVGKLVVEPLKLIRPITTLNKQETLSHQERISNVFDNSPIIPPIAPLKPTSSITHDWYQTSTTIVITIYTKRKSPEYSLMSENALVEVTENYFPLLGQEEETRHKLRIILRLPKKKFGGSFHVHHILYVLENKVQLDKVPEVKVGQSSGKVEIKLQKAEQANNKHLQWKTLGDQVKPGVFTPIPQYRPWTLVDKFPATHDVMHYILQPEIQVS